MERVLMQQRFYAFFPPYVICFKFTYTIVQFAIGTMKEDYCMSLHVLFWHIANMIQWGRCDMLDATENSLGWTLALIRADAARLLAG